MTARGSSRDAAAPSTGGRAERRRLLLVCLSLFVAALGLRLLYLGRLFATPFGNEWALMADVRYYDMRATEIARGVIFPDVPGFLSPGYSYFLGIVYALSGSSMAAAKVAQALLGAISAVLLYLAARRLFGENIGRAAGAVLALYATHVFYTGLLLPAILVTFLHLLLIWILAEGWSLRRFAVAGLVIGAAILTKANALLLCPALAVWIWLACPLPGVQPRLQRILLLCGLAAAVVAPVTINNYRVSESFLLVTTTGGSNLLKGNGPTATGTHAFLPPGAQATGVAAHLEGRVDPRGAAAQSRELSAWAWRHMRENPGRTLGLWTKKLALLFNAHERGIRDRFYFVRDLVPIPLRVLLPFWLVVPLGLAGALMALREWRRYGLLYAVILVQVASFVLIFVLARYRLVLVACLAPFAAWLIVRGLSWIRERAVRPLALALGLVVLFTAVSFVGFQDLPAGEGLADQHFFMAQRFAAEGRFEAAAESYELATAASWVDPNSAEIQRWRALLGLAEAQIELGRGDEARENLERLSAEVQRAYPGSAGALQEKIRELIGRTAVIR